MKIEQVKVDDLSPHPSNPKNHTEEQIEHIANSITQFGWTQPLVIEETGTILVGHGRALAAKKLGLERVPAYRLSGLKDADKLALLTFDNTSNLMTGFDPKMMEELTEILKNSGFDLGGLGLVAELLGSENSREMDTNKLKEAHQKYMEGQILRMVLYFEPSDFELYTQMIDQLMKEKQFETKRDLVCAMLDKYEADHK